MRQACRDNTYKNPTKKIAQCFSKNAQAVERIPDELYIYRKDRYGAYFPRGYAKEFFDRFPAMHRQMIDERSVAPAEIPALSGIELRDYQQRALEVIGRKDQGIIEAPTGSGKTIIGLGLMHLRGQRALILVHNKTLAKQWYEVIKDRTGLEAGIIGGGKWEEGETITIAIIQTLAKHLSALVKLGRGYGLLMVDECHHVPAASFGGVVNQLACKYRYGLTATRWRADGLHVLINRYLGDLLIKIYPQEVEAVGGIVPAQVQIVHSSCEGYEVDGYQDFMEAITTDEYRHQLIVGLAGKSADSQTQTLVLTDRVSHAIELYALCPKAVLVHGQLKQSERDTALSAMQAADITIGTFGLLGEGVDVAGWGALILATPRKSRVSILQSIGRALRARDGKQQAVIYDICDNHYYAESSAAVRQSIYRERGYPVEYLDTETFLRN